MSNLLASLTTPSRSAVVACALALAACGGATNETDTTPTDDTGATAPLNVETGSVAAAIAGPQRSDENRARDEWRHPAETLAFFGLEPTMSVIEMSPGGGWYTEILAPTLRDHGTLTLAQGDPTSNDYARNLMAHLAEHPEVYDQVQTVVFSPPDAMSLGPDGSADMVLTFRSVHGWVNRNQAQDVFNAMFRVLRPGGVLGLVQHRASDDADLAVSAQAGYVPEPAVIQMATAAGFVLEESSEINRNPADDHDHPEGVWTLPPTLRMGDTDRATWEAIGESDRMTLRFRRPAAEPEVASN
ncbi:MAG: class I SAM-dependent methyltransferase [Sandaracinaceae bacterium]